MHPRLSISPVRPAWRVDCGAPAGPASLSGSLCAPPRAPRTPARRVCSRDRRDGGRRRRGRFAKAEGRAWDECEKKRRVLSRTFEKPYRNSGEALVLPGSLLRAGTTVKTIVIRTTRATLQKQSSFLTARAEL